eukprot:Anaeramoba_ignava/a347514_13.p2 GENE.a347514_13~~a347514_13.p2  ORF type:complete len:418 (+),score=94.54 a347514_13:1771-3024(+)
MTITVPAETAEKDYVKVLKDFRKYAAVPGFRKGKAPMSMVEKLYGAHAKEEFIKSKLPEYYTEAVDGDDITPISQGQPLKWDWEKGKDFTATFRFEVKPEIKVEKYKELEVPFEKRELPAEAIDGTIEEMQKKMASIEETEDAVDSASIVNVDIQLPDEDGNYKEPFSRELAVGENQFSKEFNEKVIGLKKGDEFNARLFEPREDDDSELLKKEAKVTIKAVKIEVLPEIDDDLAKDADYDSLDEMKEKIAEELQKNMEKENERSLKDAITMALIQENPFDVPPSLIENYAANMAKPMAQQYNIPVEQLIEGYKKLAEIEIKKYYIIDELKKVETFEITEDDKKEMIEELAGNMNMTAEEYSEKYKSFVETPDFEEAIKEKKLYKLIEESSTFVKVPEAPEAPEAPAEAEEVEKTEE